MIMQKTYQPDFIKALLKAQNEIDPILKDATNPYFQSKYATLSAVLESVTKTLNANGFVITQPTYINEQGENCLMTIIQHESGEAITAESKLIYEKNNMQSYGASVTYARRYQLTSLLGVCAEDDIDGNKPLSNGVVKITDKEKSQLIDLAMSMSINEDKMLGSYGVQDYSELTKTQYRDCLTKLIAKKDRQNANN